MNEVLNNLISKTAANTRSFVKETYIKDGLEHCVKCKAPVQTKIMHPFTNKEVVVNCICQCEVERLKQEEEDARNREKQRRIEQLQKSSLLGDRYRNVNFDNTEIGTNKMFDEAFKRCKNYCNVASKVLESGYGIYIYGDKGCGKTHLTACMVNELIKQGRPVMFTNFFEISQIIRNTFNKSNESEIDMIDKISNIDFLFIDDLGTEKVSNNGEDNWLQGKIFEILNKRYNNKKPTIFTSNYSLQELISNRGIMDKTVDRILEMSSLILKIEGKSYRMKTRDKEIPF